MPLAAGTRIGGYEILALLGAGGMGEVYRARDARLGRDVAIKIVSPSIAADADGLMRFEREARVLASLNHPNIAAIYGVDDNGGAPALILELVEGDTLADRIARGPIPVDEALAYARQIADALDAAHERGVVHRDLKPANIKITDAGGVKVLDFGLAKAIAAASASEPSGDPTQSPTITVRGTRDHVILGTAAYMSPEQARGKSIDKRTDIWAFGCVVYEMLSGHRAFAGETTSDVIAAIIERPPDLSKLPPPVPPHVRHIVARCLEKDPKRRARDIADVRVQLDEDAVARPAARRRNTAAVAAVVASLAAIAALAVAAFTAMTAPTPSPAVVEFTFGPPPDHTFGGGVTVSPDGRYISFIARDAKLVPSLWVRPLDTGQARRLDGTEGTSGQAVWSPDSQSLAFFAGNAWKRTTVDSGPVVTIVPSAVSNLGASWGPDDQILMAPANRTALSRVPAAGGSLEPVTTLDLQQENSHRWPQILPDGRSFLFTVRSDRPENLGIKLGTFGSSSVRPLLRVPSSGRYAEPGWLLFMTPDEVLMAQRFDAATGTLSGAAQPLVASVRYNGPSFEGVFHPSRDGRVLVYAAAARSESVIAWFDRSGKMLGTAGPERRYRALRVSPDGRTAAVELADERHGTRDLWLLDTATNALTRLTTNPATDWRAVFSPDGRHVAFASDRAGASTVFRVPIDGSGPESVFYRHANGGAFPWDWSRDGKHLLVQIEDSGGRRGTLIIVPVDGGSPRVLIENEQAAVMSGRFSPDGRRVAFVSAATGRPEVYVLSIDDKRRVRVSAEGGLNPVWGRDGRELFFEDRRNQVMKATLDLERGGAVSAPPAPAFRPCEALRAAVLSEGSEAALDVAPDGARFLVRCDPADATPSTFTVVVNWQSRLR